MKNTLFIPEQKTDHFYLPSHTVTWNQNLEHLERSFSKGDLETFLSLYEIAETDPKKALRQIEEFKKIYPNHPEVLNLLSYVYIRKKKIRQSDKLIEENFKKNPDYLFARINFADLCLRRKKPQKIPELFNHAFSLRDFCPEKNEFHISEFRGFTALMGHYHLQIKKLEIAECYHYLAHRTSPNHPSTKFLEKKLYYKPFYKRLILKLFRS